MHPVVTLILGVIRQRCSQAQEFRLIEQCEIEWIGTGLAWAVHVRHGLAVRSQNRVAIGVLAEALRPFVPTAGLSGINQFQRRAPVRSRSFLVKVDRDIRDQRLPAQLEQQRRVVKWAC